MQSQSTWTNQEDYLISIQKNMSTLSKIVTLIPTKLLDRSWKLDNKFHLENKIIIDWEQNWRVRKITISYKNHTILFLKYGNRLLKKGTGIDEYFGAITSYVFPSYFFCINGPF